MNGISDVSIHGCYGSHSPVADAACGGGRYAWARSKIFLSQNNGRTCSRRADIVLFYLLSEELTSTLLHPFEGLFEVLAGALDSFDDCLRRRSSANSFSDRTQLGIA